MFTQKKNEKLFMGMARIYNDKEYVKLLTSVGFVVDVYNISARYNKNGLNPLEDLYICKKK